jgi:hypothetical protein
VSRHGRRPSGQLGHSFKKLTERDAGQPCQWPNGSAVNVVFFFLKPSGQCSLLNIHTPVSQVPHPNDLNEELGLAASILKSFRVAEIYSIFFKKLKKRSI